MVAPLHTLEENSLEDLHPLVCATNHHLVISQALIYYHSDYMLYSRGSSGDWDRFANVSGDQGWKWDNMLKYAFKVRTCGAIELWSY